MDKGLWGWAANAVDTFQKVFVAATGAVHVLAQELGIEIFESNTILLTPLAVTTIPWTVPAGCYTIEIRPTNKTEGTLIILSTVVAFRVNTTFTNIDGVSQILLAPGDDPIRLSVQPADIIYYRSITGASGSFQFLCLG